ncbi:hypothetical protein BJX63DRAFT_432073 [Aspergillus granulosus]|uniref:RING-type domain-containing protein n=1 Tax=Aspergillus granulosus TaxID=176169 RepID=A0ABR4HCP4_9EURO
MNSDFHQPTVQDAGFQTSALPNASHYIDYTQPLDLSGSIYEFPSPTIGGQGYSLPQFGENPLVSSTGGMASAAGYSTAPFATSQNLGNATTAPANTSLSSFANFDNFTTFPPQWSRVAQTTSQQSFDASSYIAQLPANLQSIPFTYIAPYRTSLPAQLSVPPQGNRSNPAQHSAQTPAAPNAQPRMRAESSTTAHLAHLSHSPATPASSLSGSSLASSQQRRHQRTSSLASPPQFHSSRHYRSRSNTTHSRPQARPQSTATGGTVSIAPSMRGSLFHEPEHQPFTSSQTAQSTTVTAAPRRPDRSETRARRHAYLRNMHSSDVQAMYEETLRHASLYNASWGQKKGLDIPQEDRPEPKETEDLTLNMECKVCMAQLIDTVLLPCGHAILCRWCADQQFPSHKGNIKGKTPCPMCRETVRQRVRSFF